MEASLAVSTNKSQASLKTLRARILDYTQVLPGPMTPQKLTGLDADQQVDAMLYSRVLESLVETFDANWPVLDGVLDEAVRKVFVVEGSDCQMLNESLLVLTEGLKSADNVKVVDGLAVVLEYLVKSDAVLSAILKSSRATDAGVLERSSEEETWQSVVQIVASLPNRVANKMQRRLLETFKLKNFTRLLSFHVSRAVYYLCEASHLCNMEGETKVLSMLISKMFLVFSSDDLLPLVDVSIHWCVSNVNDSQVLLQRILLDVDSHSVESLAVAFLKHPSFTPRVFGDLAKNANWRHALTTRIPLMSWYTNETLIKNLIAHLCHTQTSDDRVLVNLVVKLLEVWGDQSALNHTTFDQHFYITKLIVLAVKSMRKNLTPSERDEIQKHIFAGIPVHLGSTQVEVRAVGMITGEMLTGLLIRAGEECKLEFEYESMPKSALVLVEALKSLEPLPEEKTLEGEDEELVMGEMEFSNLGCKKVYQLGVDCKILKDASVPEPEPVVIPLVKPSRASEVKANPPQIQSVQDEDLDSDDDLVPYDMSNDVPESEKLKPLYLRDLRDNLVDPDSKNQNPEVFSETLKASEDLILTQLKNDDPSFAIELLEIFLNLQERSHVDDFELLVFKACCAIVTVHPSPTAEYLCKEFHSDLSRYSVEARLFMLNVLCQAATRLSSIELPNTEIKESPVAKRRKVGKPVSLFIETDKSKKYETLYDDDFDDPEESRSTVDWQEVVQRRLATKTRHFAHETKLPKTTINKFGNHVASFFYPLIHGLGSASRGFMYDLPRNYDDHKNVLLTRYLETLAIIMNSAQNCPVACKMGKELLELAWTLRYHEQGRVRLATMKCVAAVLIGVPEFEVRGELLGAVMEIRMWLVDVTRDGVKGDSDGDCRELGRQLLGLVESVLQGLIRG